MFETRCHAVPQLGAEARDEGAEDSGNEPDEQERGQDIGQISVPERSVKSAVAEAGPPRRYRQGVTFPTTILNCFVSWSANSCAIQNEVSSLGSTTAFP